MPAFAAISCRALALPDTQGTASKQPATSNNATNCPTTKNSDAFRAASSCDVTRREPRRQRKRSAQAFEKRQTTRSQTGFVSPSRARAPSFHHRPQAGRKESRPTQTNTARRKMRNPARVISPVQARSKRAVPTRSLCPGPFHASMKPQRSTCTRVTSPPSSSSSPRGATV